MKFETDRLSIREVTLADTATVHKLNSLPETDKYNTLGIPGSIQVTEDLVTGWVAERSQELRKSYVFVIEEKQTHEFIGLIALVAGKPKFKNAELWYKLHPAQWRKGYASEAVTRLLEYSFGEMKFHRMEAGCAIENIASVRVLEKVGMTREGIKRKILPIRGEWVDAFTYSILEEEFYSRNK